MTKRECRVCHGTGYILDRLLVAATFGLALLVGWLTSDGDPAGDPHRQVCGACQGDGFL